MILHKENFFFLVSILAFFLTSFFSSGYHHFDEHFQILEFAGYKLNMTMSADLPWEFNSQIRSSFQPIIVICLYKFLALFGVIDPFVLTFILRLLSALICLITLRLLYRLYKNQIVDKNLSYWFIILSFLLWFIVYNGVRFSSENWSGMLFAISFCLYFLIKNRNILFFLYVGLILGFSFLCRYQSGFLIAGFIFWITFIKQEQIRNLLLIVSGVLISIVIGIFFDRWFYNEWTYTAFNYAWQYLEHDVIKGNVSVFGHHPWWWYFKESFLQAIPPFSLMFIFSILLVFFLKRRSVLTWTIFPFVFIHFIIGHKEMRFLFPIIYFLPIILIKGFQIINLRYIKHFSNTSYMRIIMKVFFILNFIYLVGVMLKPADNHISLYKTIYQKYNKPTVLHYVSNNPFYRVRDIHKNKDITIHFYKRKDLEFKQVNSIHDILLDNTKENLVVLENKNDIESLNIKHKHIYSTIPEWLILFNINNWLSRVRRFYVYEIDVK